MTVARAWIGVPSRTCNSSSGVEVARETEDGAGSLPGARVDAPEEADMDDVRDRETPRFSDPLFNGGQQMRVHDGDATRLTVDDGEERRFQVDAGDGHDVTARPPAGTVGADRAPGISGGGPQTHRQTHDDGDVLAERFGSASDTFDGSAAGWTEEPLVGGGSNEPPRAAGDAGARQA